MADVAARSHFADRVEPGGVLEGDGCETGPPLVDGCVMTRRESNRRRATDQVVRPPVSALPMPLEPELSPSAS